MMHMQDLWRGQFADPALRRLVDEIDRRAEQGSGYTQDDHARVAITIPQGVCARDLDDEQRHTLRQLLAVYTGRAPRDLAGAYTARYESDPVLDGATSPGRGAPTPASRTTSGSRGPAFSSSTTTTQRHANHAHSVWRDLTSDFGLDALAEHRAHTAHD